MNEQERWLAVAVEAAVEAGEYLQTHWQTSHTIRYKGHRDLVTEADVASETLILNRLHAAFPDHAITSEEGGGDESAGQGIRWLIDPIDGTTNFSRNNPTFSVSIAALENGEPAVGVVYDPLRRHLFAARRNGGATLNGEPLHTSGIAHPERAVSSVDWPRNNTYREQMWWIAGTLLTHSHTLRAIGSAALAITYVGAGWLDFYAALSLKPWDQAAAILIVQEAGGAVETVSHKPWTPMAPDPMLAATPQLLTAFRDLLDGAERR